MYENYKDLAKRIRKNCLHMCYVGQGGHIGSMLSAADIMAVLYGGGFVKFDPKNPKWEERDRFILSKGHAGAPRLQTRSRLLKVLFRVNTATGSTIAFKEHRCSGRYSSGEFHVTRL